MNTELSNTITLGNEFLQHKVKRDYSDHKTALVREFLQNSMDAESTKIRFDFDSAERTLTIHDDGVGMDDFVMTNYLFNIGGSFKEKKDSVGGFGAAKLILLFQHEYFKITSYKNGYRYDVNGVGSQYSTINKTPSIGNGTIIEIKFLEEWGVETYYDNSTLDTYHNFASNAVKFLSRCDFGKAKVYWNDEEIKPLKVKTVKAKLSWCTIYSEKTNNPSNYVTVRIRGIKMFQMWCSNVMEDYCIELTKNSLSILTSNRDGLLYKFRNELEAILEKLSSDNKYFKRLKGKRLVFAGMDSSFLQTCKDMFMQYNKRIVEALEKRMDQARDIDDHEEVQAIHDAKTNFKVDFEDTMAELDNKLDTVTEEKEEVEFAVALYNKFHEASVVKTNISGMLSDVELNELKEDSESTLRSKTSSDFLVSIDKDIPAIPSRLDPSKGLIQKYHKMAQLWKHSIDVISSFDGKKLNYKIGWIISDEAQAAYAMKDSIHQFLVNPEDVKLNDTTNKKLQVKRIFRAAVHEYTHSLGYDVHNEAFVTRLEELYEAEDTVRNWKTFEKEAYAKKI